MHTYLQIAKDIADNYTLYFSLPYFHVSNNVLVVHYSDVIMGAIASQITNLTIVYLIVYSEANDDL